MADGLSSGTVNGQKLEGSFSVHTGGPLGVYGRELGTFNLRYPDGSTYRLEPGCKSIVADTKNPPGAIHTSDEIAQDAVALMRNNEFAAQETRRFGQQGQGLSPLGRDSISAFADKLENEKCVTASIPAKPRVAVKSHRSPTAAM